MISPDIIFLKAGTQEQKINQNATDFGLRQRMLSLKGNLQLLCLRKPHPLFMFERNGSSYWESVCLARKKMFVWEMFYIWVTPESQNVKLYWQQWPQARVAGKIQLKAFGERGGFPLPPSPGKWDIWTRPSSFWAGTVQGWGALGTSGCTSGPCTPAHLWLCAVSACMH